MSSEKHRFDSFTFFYLLTIYKNMDNTDSSEDIFQFFLQYIYLGVDVKINSDGANLDEILEILNLAEKYGLIQLVSEISDVITEDLVVTEENVMEVSETARLYSCFEKVSTVLYNKCSSYYRNIKFKLHHSEPGGSDEVFVYDETFSSQISEEERKESTSCDEINRVKMTLKNVCWMKFLSNDTALPCDVTFKFYKKRKNTEEEFRFVGDIKAHKFLLSSCSQVFKESFFNSSNRDNEVIIEDSSLSAFKIMIDYIYGRFPKLRGREAEDICEIFEIENLADQYKIAGLKEEYRASMLLYLRYR